MGNAISKLTIKGYKSIRNLENFELRNINILIGPNGSGKSNFIDLFRLLRAIMVGSLSTYIKTNGGCDYYLFNGSKYTKRIETSLEFKNLYEYKISLLPTVKGNFIIENEIFGPFTLFGGMESNLIEIKNDKDNIEHNEVENLYKLLSEVYVYHFHDTSDFARLKFPNSEGNFDYLFPDASNLGPFLFRIKEKQPRDYQFIIEVIRLAAPFFNDFKFDINEQSGDVKWWWSQKGSDYQFHPSQISDGTLRFICLATALLQPNPPSTILLDEPEFGLHPMALSVLAGLIQKASFKSQIIVSTQSASLIDHFQPEDIILVERKNDESIFIRPDTEKLKIWLEDYSLGDLWSRNVINGVSGQ